ncbi:MAG: agmatine deiminase family protein, partial [Porphyromonadaceae bacterium]|nr:agmatine deiminase family protein [Porphyromonadaceae bacterium]
MIVYKSNSNSTSTLIPEWEHAGAVLLSWPHKDSDWAYMLDEVTQCFEHLALTILNHSNLIIVTPSKEIIPQSVTRFEGEKLRIVIMPTNDTWARDFGPLSLKNNDGSYSLVDFGFNAWGLKFASCFDNKICRNLFAQKGIWDKDIKTVSRLGFILEGGAIESNGCGTILTTASCIFEANRNPELSNEEICQTLCDELGAKNLIVLQHGSLKGDDTDGHIDTLVRICD